jgi:hypothetical protein
MDDGRRLSFEFLVTQLNELDRTETKVKLTLQLFFA